MVSSLPSSCLLDEVEFYISLGAWTEGFTVGNKSPTSCFRISLRKKSRQVSSRMSRTEDGREGPKPNEIISLHNQNLFANLISHLKYFLGFSSCGISASKPLFAFLFPSTFASRQAFLRWLVEGFADEIWSNVV